MMLWIIDKVRTALTFSREENVLSRAHIVFKICSIAVIFAASIAAKTLISSIIVLIYPVVIAYFTKRAKVLLEALEAVIVPITLLILFTWLLSPEGVFNIFSILRALIIGSRVLAIALTLLIMFTYTNPLTISILLEKCKVPIVLSQSIILTWRLIPLVLKDFLESFTSIKLRNYHIWEALIPLTAVSMERAFRVSETLYVKGFGWTTRRTYIVSLGRCKEGLLLLIIAILMLLAVFVINNIY